MDGFNEFVLDIAVVERGGAVTVRLAGELDFFTVEQLRAAVHDAWEKQPRRLVIDLSNLSFIDLRGVNALTELTSEFRRRGVPVEISHQNRAIERLAQLLEVDEESLLGRAADG